MKGFKEPIPADRQAAAMKAKKAALEKFREKVEDPGLAERQAERAASRAESDIARRARKEQKAEEARRAAELAEQAAREAIEKAARDLEEKKATDLREAAERKAVRDARYAARKARKGK